jgi:hypothetical protein
MNCDQIIYDNAIANGYNPAACQIIAAHARYITDDYKSETFKANNNLFGLRYVKQPLATRGTQVEGEGHASYYAKYETPADSVRDLVWRLFSHDINSVTRAALQEVRTVDDYADVLKLRMFYEGSNTKYADSLRAKLFYVRVTEIVNTFKSTADRNKPVIMAALTVVAAIVGCLKFL